MKKISPQIFESSNHFHIRIHIKTPYTNGITYKIKKDKSLDEIINRRIQIINIWKNALKNTTKDNDLIWQYEKEYLHEDGKNKFWILM